MPVKLSVLWRTSAKQNAKPRPDWFCKSDCLRSLLRACRLASAEIDLTIVADGGTTPESCHEIIVSEDLRVVPVTGGNNRRSFLSTLEAAKREYLAGAEFIWVCEDDYIYGPDSISELVTASREFDSRFFALYSPDDSAWHVDKRSQPLLPVQNPVVRTSSTDIVWRQVMHTTSTFGMTREGFEDAYWCMRLVSYSGGPFSHTMSSVLQGRRPFSWRGIHRDLNLRTSLRSFTMGMGRIPMRAAANMIAVLRAEREENALLAPERDLISHIETGHVSPALDWQGIANCDKHTERSARDAGGPGGTT